MNTEIVVQNILPNSEHICFVVPSLFSCEECALFLSEDVRKSFQKAISNYPTYYRNNDRLVIDNEQLASYLFQKVKAYLPEKIEVSTDIQSENGIWYLLELNNRLRFCKYSANQYFHRHLDGIHYRDTKTQSKLTFMIYLNNASEFTGGRTLFYKTKDTQEIWASYIPRQGDLIVFDHNVWHEGEILTQGEKFVLRSDILYTKKPEQTDIDYPFSNHLGYIWSLLKWDDQTILSGGRDKEIKIWSIAGKLKSSLKGHQNSVLCIEKINNEIFVSGARDQQIIIWKNFQITHSIKIHSAIVLSLCRLDNHTFASSSGDNTIKITNIDGTVTNTLEEHTNWVWQVIKLHENTIITCSEDCTIKIWDVQQGQSITTFYENVPIISIAFNPDTRQLVSGNLNGEVCIRTLSKEHDIQETKTFQAHTGIIRTIKFINDNQITTGGEDNKVKLWNINGQLISEFEHQNFVQSIEIIDNTLLMSASYDGTIKKWSIRP